MLIYRLPGRKLAGIALLTLGLSANAWSAPFGSPWEIWQTQNELSRASINHSLWQTFLDEYVIAGDDGINLVDYSRAARCGQPLLQQYLQQLAALDPRHYNRLEQFSFWINAYNALTISIVLDYPDKNSIRNMGRSILARSLARGPWDDDVITIAGQPLSLNDIEHRILRPIWRDHRIHYAVNCASLGCPNLSPTAYTAQHIDAGLTAAEHAYINHPRGLSFAGHTLRVSSIFQWYRDDFAASDKALLRYLADHHTSLSERIRNHDGTIEYNYDWALNQTLEPRSGAKQAQSACVNGSGHN